MTYFVYSFCALVVSFKKRMTVPGVRHLVTGLFIADAQVRCQPSPCVPFCVQSINWGWIFAE